MVVVDRHCFCFLLCFVFGWCSNLIKSHATASFACGWLASTPEYWRYHSHSTLNQWRFFFSFAKAFFAHHFWNDGTYVSSFVNSLFCFFSSVVRTYNMQNSQRMRRCRFSFVRNNQAVIRSNGNIVNEGTLFIDGNVTVRLVNAMMTWITAA